MEWSDNLSVGIAGIAPAKGDMKLNIPVILL